MANLEVPLGKNLQLSAHDSGRFLAHCDALRILFETRYSQGTRLARRMQYVASDQGSR
jgi:hypothetical protein